MNSRHPRSFLGLCRRRSFSKECPLHPFLVVRKIFRLALLRQPSTQRISVQSSLRPPKQEKSATEQSSNTPFPITNLGHCSAAHSILATHTHTLSSCRKAHNSSIVAIITSPLSFLSQVRKVSVRIKRKWNPFVGCLLMGSERNSYCGVRNEEMRLRSCRP